MIRLGVAAESLGELGVEAATVGDCIRAIHRAPLEIRAAPLEQMLITELPDGQVQLLVMVGQSLARRRLEDDWVTIKSWRDLLTAPPAPDIYAAVTVADYVYGPLEEQEVVVLNPCNGEWLRHPLSGGAGQPSLFR